MIKEIVLAMMKSGKSLKQIDAAIREMVSNSLPAADRRLYHIMRVVEDAQNKLGQKTETVERGERGAACAPGAGVNQTHA